MSIVTLTQFKGGVGKTTCSIAIADLLNQNAPTLLIDSDPNRSATLWARKGLLPFQVCSDAEAPKLLMSGQFQHTVIDTPARPASDEIKSLAQGADLLVLPSSPDPLSISALAQIAQSLPEQTNYLCLLSIVPPAPQKDGPEALAALERYGLPVFSRQIRRYKAYIRAADMGVSIAKAPGGRIAWHDWEALKSELWEALEL